MDIILQMCFRIYGLFISNCRKNDISQSAFTPDLISKKEQSISEKAQ